MSLDVTVLSETPRRGHTMLHVTTGTADRFREEGRGLMNAGRLAEAEQALTQALALAPQHGETLRLLGVIANMRGDLDRAEQFITSAMNLMPDNWAVHASLGNLLRSRGRVSEATEAFERAVELAPDMVEARNNLGNAYQRLGRFDQALFHLREAVQRRPDYLPAWVNLGGVLKEVGKIEEGCEALHRAVQLAPNFAALGSKYLFDLQYHPAWDARRLFEEHARWGTTFGDAIRKVDSYYNDRTPDRRLKIGYISGDFREHVVANNLRPLFREHDRSAFNITCYSFVESEDAITGEFRRHANAWRDIRNLTDDQAAQQIRADGIDILVDLALHTSSTRLLTFARKPAPVQVTFGGYPGTTGLKTIDWRISDPHLDPPGMFDDLCTERIWRIDSFWCYEPTGNEPDVTGLPARKNGYITFGSLNSFGKVNQQVLALWHDVLRAVPDSRLLLLSPEGSHREEILRGFEAAGVERTRIEFVAWMERRHYLEQFGRIDISLDPFPYGGHTTGLDSLWMGVPVVTLAGRTIVGRAGFSHLTNLNLPEWIAQSPADYVAIAARNAKNLEALAQLRAELRSRMKKSILTDAHHFTNSIEQAYRKMWLEWLAKQ